MRLRILVILSVVVAALIVLLKWGPRRTAPPPVETVETPSPGEPAVPPTPAPAPPPVTLPPLRSNRMAPPPIVAEPTVAAPVVPVASSDLATNWPDRLDEILVGSEPESKKAEALFALLPKLPLDGQEEVAQHMVNLLTDEQFPATGTYIDDTNTPETVTTILMNDMLNRPDPVKLPMLLNLAQVTGHPLAEEAKTILGLYVEEDYGNDWNQWRKGIDDYLKKEAELERLENQTDAAPGAPAPPAAQ